MLKDLGDIGGAGPRAVAGRQQGKWVGVAVFILKSATLDSGLPHRALTDSEH